MNFSEALERVKMGYKVYRSGWNGKGMFLFLANAQWSLSAGEAHVFENLRTVVAVAETWSYFAATTSIEVWKAEGGDRNA